MNNQETAYIFVNARSVSAFFNRRKRQFRCVATSEFALEYAKQWAYDNGAIFAKINFKKSVSVVRL